MVRCPDDVIEELSDLFSTVKPGESGGNAGPVPGKTAKGGRKTSFAATQCELRLEAPPTPVFSIEEAMVMREVDNEGVSIDRLVELTGLDASKVNSVVMALRLKGRLRFLPGNRVATPRQ